MDVLEKSATVAFSGGTATAVIQNGGLTTWTVTLMNISTTSSVQTKCTVYKGDPSPANQRDFTRTGNGDTSSCELTIRPGEKLTAQWLNGSVGAFAVFTITGEETR